MDRIGISGDARATTQCHAINTDTEAAPREAWRFLPNRHPKLPRSAGLRPPIARSILPTFLATIALPPFSFSYLPLAAFTTFMDDLEAFLVQFERELASLRRDMLPFEDKFPKAASRLSLSGGQSNDPHVERAMQSAALINARVSQRIDDHYPEFNGALVETVFPIYLQPVPSCSIVQFGVRCQSYVSPERLTIPQGTQLEHRPSLCGFTTSYDVTLAPLAITRAAFSPLNSAAGRNAPRVADDTAGFVSIGLAAPGRGLAPGSALFPTALRLYLHGSPRLAATLADLLLLRPQPAFVEVDGGQRWLALDKPPAAAVGFGAVERLLGHPARDRQPALRLLMEYAAFPQKFRFVDIDLATLLRTTGPCETITLHFPVAGYAANAVAIEQLRQLSADNVRLFCTPVINRFSIEGDPADVKEGMSRYAVSVPEREGAPTCIQSVDSVRMMYGDEGAKPGAEIPPHRSLQHWSSAGVFWQYERDKWLAEQITGSNNAIHFVDLNERSVTPKATKIAMTLTCTNGDLSGTLAIGAPDGDLHSEALNFDGPVSMLIPPSASVSAPQNDKALWRLISALSPNAAALLGSSLAELQALLHQFSKTDAQRGTEYIAGIVGLDCRRIRRMMNVEPVPMPVLVPGIQTTLTIDETAFAGRSIHTFAVLMEQYFLRYAGQDCIEVVVRSRRDEVIYHGEPKLGPTGLLIA